jgi:hypothetical protein
MDGPLARVTRRRLLLSSAAAAAGLLATPLLTRQAAAADELDVAWPLLGYSIEGRGIEGIGPLGSGPMRVAIMGGIHGGSEWVTANLVLSAFEHFAANPHEAYPEQLALYFVPLTNPDGYARGYDVDTAFNANGVDLNRNFSVRWSRQSYGSVGGRYGPSGTKEDGGGSAPFSEPETQAIRNFVHWQGIHAVLSYHAGFESVTAKDGPGGVGEEMARIVAEATGYPYVMDWSAYTLTGQLTDWLDALGIRGVEVDLPRSDDPQWERNLAGMRAALGYLAGAAIPMHSQ